MADSIELKVEKTLLGNLKVELPSVPASERQAYRRAAFRSDNDPQGIMRIIQVPSDMDILIDEHINGIHTINERFCKKDGVNRWAAYLSMPTEDHHMASTIDYLPSDVEYQALEKLLKVSTK